MNNPAIHRLAAFTKDPQGGNPAGVVLAEEELPAEWMQATARDVGYSETAFLWPGGSPGHWTVRYFSPAAEVPFCGHATIASGVLLAWQQGHGTHRFVTRAGEVEVAVARDDGGRAELTSVEPSVQPMPTGLVDDVLAMFGWESDHLAADLPPAVAFAGARHLLLPLRSRQVLAEMRYDFEALRERMLAADLTTVALLWQGSPTVWHARNAFPVGGVVEDPATGAAAAALGGWLRIAGHLSAPASILVRQGEDQGRPSRLEVTIPAAGGIRVAGNAVAIG